MNRFKIACAALFLIGAYAGINAQTVNCANEKCTSKQECVKENCKKEECTKAGCNQETCKKAECKKADPRKHACKDGGKPCLKHGQGSRPGVAARPVRGIASMFEGIDLTAEQQAKVDVLLKDRKAKQEAGRLEKKQAKAELKAAVADQRKAQRAELEAELGKILTPAQMEVFKANAAKNTPVCVKADCKKADCKKADCNKADCNKADCNKADCKKENCKKENCKKENCKKADCKKENCNKSCKK